MRQRRRGRTEDKGAASSSPKGRGPRRPEPLVTPAKGRAGVRSGIDAPPPKRRSKSARHPLVLMANMVIFLLVVAVGGGIAALVLGQKAYVAAGPLTDDVGIIIERGSSVWDIAAGLDQQGVITNQYVFVAAAYGTGMTARMQAGEYMIPANASMEDVLDRIVSGRVIQHAITFAEGLTSAQIVARMNENDILTGLVETIPQEGSLLPETYNFARGMTRSHLIELMQTAHAKAVTEAWENRDSDLPLSSPQDLVTLASIVEKETGVATERPRVASVFVNRLRQGMKLQSDPTILYGLYGGDAWSRSRTITRSDLDRPNPYNTYQISALPPGPIANPGREALEAVANPATTRDLFFVADGTGGHVFSADYETHQRNVTRWREIERQRGVRTE